MPDNLNWDDCPFACVLCWGVFFGLFVNFLWFFMGLWSYVVFGIVHVNFLVSCAKIQGLLLLYLCFVGVFLLAVC